MRLLRSMYLTLLDGQIYEYLNLYVSHINLAILYRKVYIYIYMYDSTVNRKYLAYKIQNISNIKNIVK